MDKAARGLEATAPMRPQAVPLVLGWMAACAVGSVLGVLPGTQSFFGYLFLFGAALGFAQAIVVWRWCRRGPQPAAAWVMGSFGGWVTGALAYALLGGTDMLPWVTLGVGQTPVLFALLGQHPTRVRVGLTAVWVAASVIAALLFSVATLWNPTVGVIYQPLRPLLGAFWADVVLLALRTTVLYGLPTGAALVWIIRMTQPGSRVSSDALA